MELNELRTLVRNWVSKLYLANDAAHQIDHADDVYDRASIINDHMGLGIDEASIMLAAYLHDIGVSVSRKHHHDIGAATVLDMVINNKLPLWAKVAVPMLRDWKLIEAAVREHRSTNTEYTSALSEVIAAADRGAPDNFMRTLVRAVDYGMGNGLDYPEAVAAAVQHMHEKFGSMGTCTYPPMYLELYGHAVREHQRRADNITVKAARKFLDGRKHLLKHKHTTPILGWLLIK